MRITITLDNEGTLLFNVAHKTPLLSITPRALVARHFLMMGLKEFHLKASEDSQKAGELFHKAQKKRKLASKKGVRKK